MTLPAEVEAFVTEQIAAGKYPTADAVLSDAVLALREKQALDRKRTELIHELDIGLRQLDAGMSEPLDIDEILAEVIAESAAKVKAAG